MKKLCLLLLVSLLHVGGASAAEKQNNPDVKPTVLLKLTKIIRPDGTIVEERLMEAPIELVKSTVAAVKTAQGGSAQIEEAVEPPSDNQKKD